ncbi:glutamine--fructose-6-phosphate aminotransferase [Pycnococcus provasolii]|uniref:glutamine--fructose-6-phosphate transaminase (isomerizing) n=1 Tax=Pycnococcus provasolii TaxID=41880 RepID=A0A830HFX7_9CHLO|nr:glutamine--fructose-6-phosphate aminotransferase [Pycnococcus provasolii]|mmetsp:Transcript_5515/g.14332  ORF Transcript_5515/g.14332 Transcript_5515/m.14332 type:complete len:762 (+) Transcript_5515:101-2386(+)
MCGIFAYYNWNVPRERRAILQLLVKGLRRLEYRGYDSAGLSVDGDENVPAATLNAVSNNTSPSKLQSVRKSVVIKEQGKIDHLEAKINETFTENPDTFDAEVLVGTHCGIAHTRWATHGPPAPRNSHPQTSDSINNEFVVVHNGIITNHRELRAFLTKQGFQFESDTDTEVVPKLAKYLFSRIQGKRMLFRELVVEVMRHLDGAFALIFKSVHYPNELVACKRGSPLILGVGETSSNDDGERDEKRPRLDSSLRSAEYYLSSDAAAVVEHTKRVIVLEEGDIVHLRDGKHGVYHTKRSSNSNDHATLLKRLESGANSPASESTADGNHASAMPLEVVREAQVLRMEVEQIMKGEYDHFMLKEIFEQPDSLLNSMRGRIELSASSVFSHVPTEEIADGTGGPGKKTTPKQVRFNVPSFPRGLDKPRIVLGGLSEHLNTMNRSRRLMFVGCGTSFHAAVAARGFIEEMAEIPVDLQLASDLMDRQCPIFREDTCIFLSQSGETADTLQALRYAKARGALCVGVTNTVGSAIARETDCGVYIHCGAEIGVASTKAYTSQIVVLTMIALAMAANKNDKAARSEEVINALVSLPEIVRKALQLDKHIQSLAKELYEEQSLLVFGRGYNYSTSLEAALKVKELAYMHSEGINAGEMKHGPLALIDSNLPVIVVCTKTDAVYPKMVSVIEQLRARQARLIVLCTEDDEELISQKDKFASLIIVPSSVDILQPVVNIVPLQLLSYHLTVLREFDVDQPRNLAKSVTVTE